MGNRGGKIAEEGTGTKQRLETPPDKHISLANTKPI